MGPIPTRWDWLMITTPTILVVRLILIANIFANSLSHLTRAHYQGAVEFKKEAAVQVAS
jgi:hypothetical protein